MCVFPFRCEVWVMPYRCRLLHNQHVLLEKVSCPASCRLLYFLLNYNRGPQLPFLLFSYFMGPTFALLHGVLTQEVQVTRGVTKSEGDQVNSEKSIQNKTLKIFSAIEQFPVYFRRGARLCLLHYVDGLEITLNLLRHNKYSWEDSGWQIFTAKPAYTAMVCSDVIFDASTKDSSYKRCH